MDTLRARLGLTRGPTFLISGTIPQAHLFFNGTLLIKIQFFAYCCLISLIANSGSVARVLLFNLTGDRDPNRLLKPIMVRVIFY